MGLDLVELMIEVEKKFGIAISNEDLARLSQRHVPPDVSAGDLLDLILEKCSTICPDPKCVGCGYDLRGHAPAGICPECGEVFDNSPKNRDGAWLKLRLILASVLVVKREAISRDTMLIRDLGLD